ASAGDAGGDGTAAPAEGRSWVADRGNLGAGSGLQSAVARRTRPPVLPHRAAEVPPDTFRAAGTWVGRLGPGRRRPANEARRRGCRGPRAATAARRLTAGRG